MDYLLLVHTLARPRNVPSASKANHDWLTTSFACPVKILRNEFTRSLSFPRGSTSPLSHLASVVGSIRKIPASFFIARPCVPRYCRIFPLREDTACGNGSDPRNVMILGINRRAGPPRFFSQLVMVLVVTPSRFATS